MGSENELRERFWMEFDKSPILMIALDHTGEHSQPMTGRYENHEGPIWFYTSRNNRLVSGLTLDARAMAQYVGKRHDLFACLHGAIAIEHDPARIDQFWSQEAEAWYPESRNDPSLAMLRFKPETAEFWKASRTVKGVFKNLFSGELRHAAGDPDAHSAF